MSGKTFWALGGILAGALAVTAPAVAADLRDDHGSFASLKDAPRAAPVGNWSGFYFGGHLGAVWTDGKADAWYENLCLAEADQTCTAVVHRAHNDLGETSFIGGVHTGYNWQREAIVYGVEGDVSFAQNIDYLASVRGRLGVAAGNWLFYGTGGVAFIGGGVDGSIGFTSSGLSVAPAGATPPAAGATTSGPAFKYDASGDQVGFVVGGGVETKLSNNWSIGVEGLYYGFDGNTYTHTGFAEGVTAESFSDIAVVRGRLSYHVNPGYEPLK